MNQPTNTDLLLRYDVFRKSTAVAYLLLLFLGMFGAHRFYLKRTGSAVLMLVLTITVVFSFVSFIWVLVDLFLTHDIVRQHNLRLYHFLKDGSSLDLLL